MGNILAIVFTPLQPVFAIFGMVFSGIGAMFKALMSVVGAVFMAPFQLLWISRLGSIVRSFAGNKSPLDALDQRAKSFIGHKEVDEQTAMLIRGDRLGYAKTIIDPVKFDWAYKDVPEDLRRSIALDGRVVGGAPLAPNVAAQAITEDFVVNSWNAATQSAAQKTYFWSMISAIVLVLTLSGASVAIDGLKSSFLSKTEAIGQDLKMDLEVTRGASSEGIDVSKALATSTAFRNDSINKAVALADVFDQSDLVRITEEEKRGSLKASKAIQSNVVNDQRSARAGRWGQAIGTFVVALFLVGALIVLLSYVGFQYFWIKEFRTLIYTGAAKSIEMIQKAAWRESIQRFNKRAETNEKELRQYSRQVTEVIERDRSPVFTFGSSDGALTFRGHAGGIPRGVDAAMSMIDMNQHTLVIGGTGMGKTRNVVNPRIVWLQKLRMKGFPISLFVLDNKGALVRDVSRILVKMGVDKSEIKVIGAGEGELRMNPCEGLSPAEVGDLLVSVMTQASGSQAESDFWTESGKNLVVSCLVLAQAFERTEAGKSWADRYGFRPYSFLGLFMLISDDKQLDFALESVAQALESDEHAAIADLKGISMTTSLTWLATSWKTMAEVTKTGVQSNAQRMLTSFIHYQDLAQGFATGRGDNLVSPKELIRNGIVGLNVSQIKFGAAGRLVSIALKTMWMKFARESEINNPEMAKERERWWREQDRELNEDEMDAYAMRHFIADEYQALMTGGPGLTDTEVWNELRSAGVCGMVITQSLSSIEFALGQVGAEKFLQNFNTRIIMGSIDEKTVDFASKLGGKVQRYSVVQHDQFESVETMKLITGATPDQLAPASLEQAEANADQFADWVGLNQFAFDAYKLPFKFDDSYAPTGTNLRGDSDFQWRDQQAVGWRQEDKNLSILQNNETTEDAVAQQEIMRMGKGNALVYLQRGGMPRIDFVTLAA